MSGRTTQLAHFARWVRSGQWFTVRYARADNLAAVWYSVPIVYFVAPWDQVQAVLDAIDGRYRWCEVSARIVIDQPPPR